MPDAGVPLARMRLVVFDTETTGLSPGVDRVVEIAAIGIEDGRETGRFESLVDPGIPIPPDLIAIHGITDEMVKGRPGIAEAGRAFLEFAGDAVLAAHNAPYDMAMLYAQLTERGIEPPGNAVIDTCRLARRLVEAPNYQLSTLAEVLGIALNGAHRAMPDVLACSELLEECLARIEGPSTLADVERASAARLFFGRRDWGPGAIPARAAALQEAISTRRSVEIVYRGGSHGDRPRGLTPFYLLEMDGHLAVSARCHIDGALKNFRVGLIASARLID